jgi:hypothetical protein
MRLNGELREHLRPAQTPRLPQMEFAFRANVSPRYLGSVELGRAAPSRGLVPPGEELTCRCGRGTFGFWPPGLHPAGDRARGSSFEAVRAAIESTLEAHSPPPAFAINRQWEIVASNAAFELYEAVAPELPDCRSMSCVSACTRGAGVAILNLREWSNICSDGCGGR